MSFDSIRNGNDSIDEGSSQPEDPAVRSSETAQNQPVTDAAAISAVTGDVRAALSDRDSSDEDTIKLRQMLIPTASDIVEKDTEFRNKPPEVKKRLIGVIATVLEQTCKELRCSVAMM